ncbi:hypothetical protein JCM11641_003620 [Rhodosporidiobolus odoratus]
MAGKRTVAASDSEEKHSTTSSVKRQRTRASSDLPRSTPPPNQVGGEFDPEGASEEEEEEDEDDEMEDEEERRQAQELARSQANLPTRIAESGVITQVDLQNFMCHGRTTVSFGPQVNFLVGVNGSGKSAILTGITMALGGNAKATNRGTKGGDLIMEGKPSARCTVTLANKGEEAYMRHIYGDSITVERTLNKNGSGAYKIKNHEGKTVDTKKATLDAILDSFNIQVDNPMTVLTQDQSRQFLASASPKDKYTFFLRGTQLAQLTEEYEQIRSNVEQMEESLSRKKEVLPELKEAYRRAKARAKEATAAMQQAQDLRAKKDQLAWAYVVEVERQIIWGEGEVEKEASQLPELEGRIKEQQDAINVAEETVITVQEAEREAKQTLEEKQPRLQDLVGLIQAERERIKRWRDSERQLGGTVNRMKGEIAEVDRQIADEERKLSRDIEAERAPLRRSIEQATHEVEKLSIKIADARSTLEDTAEDYRKAIDSYEESKLQIATAEKSRYDLRNRLNSIHQSQAQPLNAYGPRTMQVLQMIDQERRWHDRPIGPIGTLVKLNQPKYLKTVESFFSATLNAFIVTNDHDKSLMNGIKHRLKLDHNVPIIRWELDETFVTAGNEPDPEILTVSRALTIELPIVYQVLVNSNRMERSALVPFRQDGDRLMRTNPRNVDAAYSGDMYQLRINNNRSSSQTMNPWKGDPRLSRDFTGLIQQIEGDLQQVEGDKQRLDQQKYAAGQKAREAEQRKMQATREQSDAQQRMRGLNQKIANWDAKLREEQPNNIAALQENKREAEAELENAQAQFRAGKEQFDLQTGNNAPIVDERKEIETTIRKAEKIAAQLNDALAAEYAKISSARNFIQSIEKKKASVVDKVARYEGEVERMRTLHKEHLEPAEAICPRPVISDYKSPGKLEKEIEGIEKALKAREKQQGATTEQIIEEMEVRKKVASEAVKQTNEVAKLIQKTILDAFDHLAKALDAAYQARIGRWTDFRDHISTRAKLQFVSYLGHRGFTGKLKFDHAGCRLNLTVQTESSGKKQKQKQKDTKSLSGGEKSFSTICLLLTMWEAVGCPIRCLDEFDVFMVSNFSFPEFILPEAHQPFLSGSQDAVNRRIAMRMMIDTAKTADQVQFVLITPQEMSSISWGSEVRVSKLDDPKRSAGALAHGA